MKCDIAQENIALAVYGELPDEISHQFDQHLAECARCREEMDAVRALHKAMALYPVIEPSASLLAKARLRLEESLDAMPHSGWVSRLVPYFFGGLGRIRSAPVFASTLVVFGLGIGSFAGYRTGQTAAMHNLNTRTVATSNAAGLPQDDDTPVANISSIVQQPNTENVEVHYNRLVPATLRGQLDDPEIRALLLIGTRGSENDGVHQNSVQLLASECRAGHACSGGPVRDALMAALRYDDDPKVRTQALDGLEPYIAEDMRVRDAVLETVMSDPDPEVRGQAIGLIRPVYADSSVRQVLHTVASRDSNPHIRTVSQHALSQLPQIQ